MGALERETTSIRSEGGEGASQGTPRSSPRPGNASLRMGRALRPGDESPTGLAVNKPVAVESKRRPALGPQPRAGHVLASARRPLAGSGHTA